MFKFCLKLLSKLEKNTYSFFIFFKHYHESPVSKLTNFCIFYHPSPFEPDIIFKEPLFDCISLKNMK